MIATLIYLLAMTTAEVVTVGWPDIAINGFILTGLNLILISVVMFALRRAKQLAAQVNLEHRHPLGITTTSRYPSNFAPPGYNH
ncbi:MAG: hypothetical protein CL873_03280 [Dehalococcoidales bacterium]|jgi:hypothetical protein|nr:hypothetical protein [Dehalococcoidales bacterium]|tara:strand:- start:1942 stop:2193 length:252 start_codon:yes stop_codon:yes gene_type:complete